MYVTSYKEMGSKEQTVLQQLSEGISKENMKTITLEDGKEVKISDESDKAMADSIQSKRWKPEVDEDYWYVRDDGGDCDVGHSYWTYDETDKFHYKTGNIYRTKEKAKTALARIIALADVREYILDNDLQVDNVDWSDRWQNKCSISYNRNTDEFCREFHWRYQKLNELPFLKSTEATNQVVKAKKKELLVIFNVK